MVTPYSQLEVEITLILSGLDSAHTQFKLPAAPQKWSVQQIVEHLLLTYRSTYGTIQQRIDKGTPTKASPSLSQRLGQFAIMTLGQFPAGRAAPPAVTPPGSATAFNGEQLIILVHEALADLTRQFSEAGQLFGTRRFASHLILGPLSLSQWSRFHLIHGRHHLRQIQAIRHAQSS